MDRRAIASYVTTMSKPDYAYEFLSRVLAGTKPSANDIDRLLSERVPEGLHLDYKSGREFDDEGTAEKAGNPTTYHGKLRKFVAGFANSDGGVLMIGVAEPPKWKNPKTGREEPDPRMLRSVDGVKLAADEAVQRTKEAIASLRPYLSRTPRIVPVEHPDGLVLVVAVERSDSLVICLEANKTVIHYLRIHDSTVSAPGYLVEDLILGRRQKTSFVATKIYGTLGDISDLHLVVQVFNTGLVWMDQVQVGLVGFMAQPPGDLFEAGGPFLIPVDQRGVSDAPDPVSYPPTCLPLAPAPPVVASLAPLHPAQFVFHGELLPVGSCHVWGGALFVVSRGQRPVWFQLVVYNRPGAVAIALLPTGGRRPVVGMSLDNTADWCKFRRDSGVVTVRLSEDS